MLTKLSFKRLLGVAPGCKRFIVGSEYLECLHNPNIDLNWDGVAGVNETGIVTCKGDSEQFLPLEHMLTIFAGEEVPLDVIIFATGYATVC